MTRGFTVLLLLLVALVGCGEGTFYADWMLDVDGDGFLPDAGGDCDDRDPAAHPDHPEICDGIDNDCDGEVDGADDELADADGDGADACLDCDDGDSRRTPGASEVCDGVDSDCDGELPSDEQDSDGDGFLACDEDCDDTSASVHDGAVESCNEIDDNCDGEVDDGLDLDSDGYTSCGGDCAPEDPDVHPEAGEGCDGLDTDCDGVVPDLEADLDADGFATCEGDCDDTNGTRYPGAPEICNAVDDSCAGFVDPSETDADADGSPVCGGDCDDGDPSAHPGAAEACDGLDNDCDGVVPSDEADSDGDGFAPCAGDCDDGSGGAAFGPDVDEVCNGLDDDCDGAVPGDELDGDSDGQAACDGDCGDGDSTIGDGFEELCDGLDNDCDGALIEGEGADADSDGVLPCADDCDDSSPTVFPGAPELCDGADNDCDTLTPGDESDADGDGVMPCEGDCDDSDPLRSPMLAELCSGIDDDCDGLVDDDDPDLPDADGDGVGPCSDCDDGSATTSPELPEICGDSTDNDCDGHVDEPASSQAPPLLSAGGGLGLADGRLEMFDLDGAGTVTSDGAVGALPSSGVSLAIVAADLDGDGTVDLLQEQFDPSDADADELTGVRGTCAGGLETFSISGIDLPGDHRIVAAADLDGDGDDDLVSARYEGPDLGELRSYLNDGFGSFVSQEAGGLFNPGLREGWTVGRVPVDHDGDALPDLVECGWSDGETTVCFLQLGQGDGTFSAPGPTLVMNAPAAAVVQGDFDSDGLADLLVGLSDRGDPGTLYLLSGDGAGGFGPPTEVFDLEPAVELEDAPGAGRGAMVATDFDTDGDLDLVVLAHVGVDGPDREIVVLQGTGGPGFDLVGATPFTSSLPDPTASDWVTAPPVP